MCLKHSCVLRSERLIQNIQSDPIWNPDSEFHPVLVTGVRGGSVDHTRTFFQFVSQKPCAVGVFLKVCGHRVQRPEIDIEPNRPRSTPSLTTRDLVQSVFVNLLNSALFTEPFICHPTVSAIKRLICIMRDHLESISQFTIIMMIFQISSEISRMQFHMSVCFQQTDHRTRPETTEFWLEHHFESSERFYNENFIAMVPFEVQSTGFAKCRTVLCTKKHFRKTFPPY